MGDTIYKEFRSERTNIGFLNAHQTMSELFEILIISLRVPNLQNSLVFNSLKILKISNSVWYRALAPS